MTTKRRTSPTTLVAGMLLVLLAGCSEPKDQVKPESLGSSNTPGLTNEEPPGETGWSCPKNTLGAKMVLIPVDEGNPYCIDEREAVYGEYKEFLAAKGGDFADQPPQCRWNDDYGPASVVDQSSSCADCGPIVYGPAIDDADPDRAVQGLDFCDAWAFCSWAGKRLCGLRGAEPGKVTTISLPDAPDARNLIILESIGTVKSEWFNVCSQGGTTKYPYGDELRPGACIDSTKLGAEGDSARSIRDTSGSECHGSTPPYDRVYNMSGNISTWVNICFPDQCTDVGGRDNNEVLSCDGPMGTVWPRELSSGVRCCANAARGVQVRAQ